MSKLPEPPDDWKPHGRPDILARSNAEQRMLYDRTRDKIHLLNETAEFIWHLCDGKNTVSDIVEQVGREFEVADTRDLTGDVERVLVSIFRLGLLVPTDAER